jgi:hypothetical protein
MRTAQGDVRVCADSGVLAQPATEDRKIRNFVIENTHAHPEQGEP